ncbi:MAG TPA: hypothetical protein VMV92_09730 [Streptosporangiaceae bacterium]|nr:hypothetical protein [Streptosporangiaceae bacterium]
MRLPVRGASRIVQRALRFAWHWVNHPAAGLWYITPPFTDVDASMWVGGMNEDEEHIVDPRDMDAWLERILGAAGAPDQLGGPTETGGEW